MTREELDKDMIESIEMWLHEIEPKWVEKELAWLEELRTRLLKEETPMTLKKRRGNTHPTCLHTISEEAIYHHKADAI